MVSVRYGDEGIIQLFRAIYRSLSAGGRLILEPQPFKSYAKKKNISAAFTETYRAIQIKPQYFPSVLIAIVGFRSVTLLHHPKGEKEKDSNAGEGEAIRGSASLGKGFDRPIYLCIK
jgi:hypothetical protein